MRLSITLFIQRPRSQESASWQKFAEADETFVERVSDVQVSGMTIDLLLPE